MGGLRYCSRRSEAASASQWSFARSGPSSEIGGFSRTMSIDAPTSDSQAGSASLMIGRWLARIGRKSWTERPRYQAMVAKAYSRQRARACGCTQMTNSSMAGATRNAIM